jgi:pimeloyl-ACP methyl ester carboxylesterase
MPHGLIGSCSSNPCGPPPAAPGVRMFGRRNAMTAIKYRSADVDGLMVFCREAGRADAPALLLLHGFPSASHMFRDLVPLLADRLHIIAPDLPGFGQSEMPARTKFTYTFDNIAGIIDRFTEVVGLKRFAIYVFDYGAPIGFRIATKHPGRMVTTVEAAPGSIAIPVRVTSGPLWRFSAALSLRG